MSQLLAATNALSFRMSNTSDSHQFGRWGEQVALDHLIHQRYRVLATRYRTPYGEIDIVAQHNTTLVFVEVKARRRKNAMALALSPHQYSRAQQAAEHFLAAHADSNLLDTRFDAIMVDQGGVLEHIEGIWEISPF